MLLLDDLLDASHITRGKLNLRVAPVALQVVVDSAIETARPPIDARHHNFGVHLPPEPITIEVDAMRLAQVIANLLTNAAKHTNAGGHIELNVAHQDDEFVISVSNGLGVRSELQAGCDRARHWATGSHRL
ncbi:MAG TPA: ATP-binding protein [Steroidobacteraceae bacterium]